MPSNHAASTRQIRASATSSLARHTSPNSPQASADLGSLRTRSRLARTATATAGSISSDLGSGGTGWGEEEWRQKKTNEETPAMRSIAMIGLQRFAIIVQIP